MLKLSIDTSNAKETLKTLERIQELTEELKKLVNWSLQTNFNATITEEQPKAATSDCSDV